MKADTNVYAWAHTVHVATSTERLVLTTLAHLLGPSGCGQVSQADVARSACITPRTAGRVMATLATSGDIEVDAPAGVKPTVRLLMRTPETVITPDTRSGVPPTHDQGYPRHTIMGTPETVSGVGAQDGAATVSKKIPPPTEGGVGGTTTTTTTDYVQAPDHFAQRRDTTTAADIDPARFQALAEDIAGRTLNKRGRFMGAGLTSRETVTVRSLIAEHGLAAVEQVVAGMPDRVDQPTAMLAKRMERHVEAQREAERERKRVRRGGLYVAKGPLKPEEISDIDVMAALGVSPEDLAS